MSQHTPGPWRVGGFGDGEVLTRASGECIAVAPENIARDIWVANARVLAAAPSMLEVVRALAEQPCLDECTCLTCRARRLVAEATRKEKGDD